MSSGFITETEVVELRQKRQEEWERVRKEDDPLERPEETYDNRSLFDRLQEQKYKKDLEYEEAHKLKNMIKGLDDDEIEFLDLVDRTKLAADRKKSLEEEKELNDYRNRVASLQEKAIDQKLQAEIMANRPRPNPNNRKSQMKLLQGIVVKKPESKKRKISEVEDTIEKKDSFDVKVGQRTDEGKKMNKGLTCIGILPGLGCYNDSTSDDSSNSDSDDDVKIVPEKLDLLGRKIIEKDPCN